ncbi:hypothetical protein CJ178_30265 [Rhodococcus sp. ACPA4]|nr:hypothetical protein CJ178_30265 [Rhodococcus sp. ACPA4]
MDRALFPPHLDVLRSVDLAVPNSGRAISLVASLFRTWSVHRSRMVIAEFTDPLCLAGLGSVGLIAFAVRIWGEGRAPVIGSHCRRL